VNLLDHKVNSLINNLTNDEDQRQELWVHYLSGHSPDSFASHLEKQSIESLIEREFQAQLWHILNNQPSPKFTELLSKLSDIEQSIACLLALGLTIGQLSRYKRITEIRIRQVISVMKENDCWEELYAEEKANRRRAPRFK
jgi:hypothetical protein